MTYCSHGIEASECKICSATHVHIEERPVVVVFTPPDMCDELLEKVFQAAENGEPYRVETNQEIVLHRLRLKAATHPEIMKNVVVLFDDGSGERQEVSLKEMDELDWPKGLVIRGIDIEVEIRKAQRKASGRKWGEGAAPRQKESPND